MKAIITTKILASLLWIAPLAAYTNSHAATPSEETTGAYIDDAVITAKVKAALVKDDTVKARDVSVTTTKGAVQISGTVDTTEQKDRAELLAWRVAGVKSVENNISVK